MSDCSVKFNLMPEEAALAEQLDNQKFRVIDGMDYSSLRPGPSEFESRLLRKPEEMECIRRFLDQDFGPLHRSEWSFDLEVQDHKPKRSPAPLASNPVILQMCNWTGTVEELDVKRIRFGPLVQGANGGMYAPLSMESKRTPSHRSKRLRKLALKRAKRQRAKRSR